jgi:septal ring-binding cell division protein DamX
MVLTSDDAEDSLKKMLKTGEFQPVVNQLYVLRRTGPDPTVMVFYGEYPNLAAARNSRNNLPVFLRKHSPYAISVFGAVQKATTP